MDWLFGIAYNDLMKMLAGQKVVQVQVFMILNISIMTAIGKQTNGSSPSSIKQMAIRAMKTTGKSHFGVIADLGAGWGELSYALKTYADKIWMLDDFVPDELPEKAEAIKVDLNNRWNLPDNSVDFLFSLEVVEHIENPRHFFRETARVIKPGGYGFVSTPNNLNFFSRVNFLLKGCHRFFKDDRYPAHISPLMKIDLMRIIKENNLLVVNFFYNNEDVIPLLGKRVSIKGGTFSDSIGVLFTK